MAKYKIAETETFEKKINSIKYKSLYQKITDYVYPILRENPYFGPNIKKLALPAIVWENEKYARLSS